MEIVSISARRRSQTDSRLRTRGPRGHHPGVSKYARRLLLAALLCLSSAGLGGCGPPPKDPAVVAYEQLVGAVRRGDAAALWAVLTPQSREALARRLGVAPDEKAVLEHLGVRPGWQFELDLPERARVVESGADRRVVRGPLAGRAWDLVVVNVDGAWRIDLFASEPAPDAGT